MSLILKHEQHKFEGDGFFSALTSLIPKVANFVSNNKSLISSEVSNNPNIIKSINTQNNYENEINNLNIKPQFKVEDRVRIFKYKSKFEKDNVGFWTNEIFIVDKVNTTSPPTYELIDQDKEQIIGRFYQNELQKTYF